jgi:hypothetical protein
VENVESVEKLIIVLSVSFLVPRFPTLTTIPTSTAATHDFTALLLISGPLWRDTAPFFA